ncbi:MAG: DUF362 domain-containing protein [Promethearchaeota archaeon]
MKAKVVVQDVETIRESLLKVFDPFDGLDALGLQQHSKIFIKYNGIHHGKEMYTDPVVLGELVKICKEYTDEPVYVIENSTQSNFSRMVAELTGIAKTVKKNGGRNVYLDEQPAVIVHLGEDQRPTKFPRILYRELIQNKGSNFLLNVPKLKTHLMSTVTLGLKCFMGLLYDNDKQTNHNFRLHQKLVDTVKFIQPDFTLIEGINATRYGHFPPQSLLSECIVPMNVFIGSNDVVACDVVGAKILGYTIDEVKHIALAAEQGLGVGNIADIEIIGDISRFTEKLPFHPPREVAPDITFIVGKEQACVEGCYGNTCLALVYLREDYQGRGGFSALVGRGISEEDLDDLPGDILLVGSCTIEENLDRIKQRYSDRKIFTVNACNDLAQLTRYLTRLMKVKAIQMVPANPLKSLWIILKARLHGLNANIPPLF